MTGLLSMSLSERSLSGQSLSSLALKAAEEAVALSYADLILTTGANGEEHTVTEGGTYTFSTVITPNAWFRKGAFDVADADLIHDATISGAVGPASETPAFTDTVLNSGTVTSDGTIVTWDADVEADSRAASFLDRVFPAGSGLFFEGLINVTAVGSVDNVNRCFLWLRNGTRSMFLSLHQDAGGGMRLIDAANVEIGTVNESFDLLAGSETFIEVLHDSVGETKVWKDHEATSILEADYTASFANGERSYRFGNFNSAVNVTCECTMRDAKFLRLN